jgi:hypothetical protein
MRETMNKPVNTILKPIFKTSYLCALIAGCGTTIAPEPEIDESEQALSCPVPVIDPARSLFVTDPTALALFPFQRVMTQIATTGGASNTPLAMYQDWMATFADCTNPLIDPSGYGIVCPRVESTLGSFNPFQQTGPRFVPVGIVNRFDLAPKTGADCGEYRIVFAELDFPGRAFIIFEARLPNPTPSAGLCGCTPVADFWAGLSSDPSAASRAAKLEQFYFSGLPGFEPAVEASHYGLARDANTLRRKGQVRTNFFVESVEWQLREFQLLKECNSPGSCKLSFQHVMDKTNPANELFTGTHANAPAFQAAFLGQIPALSANSAAKIAMTNSVKFDEFESVSQPGATDVVYSLFTQQPFRDAITAALGGGATLNETHILRRATTQTCAGCHRLSSGIQAQLGDGVVWPQSLDFVHVNETSQLSPALLTSFLPHRAQVLSQFLQQQCTGPGLCLTPATDDGKNIGGGPTSAAN